MLTEVKVKSARPREKQYKLTDSGGMYLLVRPNGKKYWQAAYRFEGKQKTLSLGVYPKVSLAAARVALFKAKDILALGRDPIEEKIKKENENLVKKENTFESVAMEWFFMRKEEWNYKYASLILSRMQSDIFPFIGNIPLKEITPKMVIDTLRKAEDRGIYDVVRRLQSYLGQVFRYAIITERAETNPARDIGGALKKKPKSTGYTAMPVNELARFKHALADYRGMLSTRFALSLMLLTFVRTSEMTGAHWSEIDIDKAEWLIPPERMKMKTAHLVPLSRQALAVLEEARPYACGDIVFPSWGKNGTLSNNAMLYALYRMGWRGRATVHGFRAVASTVLNEHGWPPDVIEKQLAHEERNKVRAAYNRAEYLPQRREMMQWWADWLDKLASEGLPTA